MKISCGDDIVIFLNKLYIKSLDLKDKCKLEILIKKVINQFNIDLNGFIDVKIYSDNNFGIICVVNSCGDYFDYFSDDLNMNIEIINDTFLYKVNDIYSINDFITDFVVFKFKEGFYLKCLNINDYKLGVVLENADIIYGAEALKVLKNGANIKSEVII